MPLARLIPVIGFGALAAGLACACLPWSVPAPALTVFVTRELASAYGIALISRGPTQIALLPLPRLGFADVRLTAGSVEGPVLAEGGALTIQLNLFALLTGRIDVNTLTLDNATIRMPMGDDDVRWSEPIRLLNARLAEDEAAHPRRVSLSRVTATGRDPRDGTLQTAREIDLAVSWPLWSAQADITGGFLWNATPARFTLSGVRVGDALAGMPTPFTAEANWGAGSLSAEGSGVAGADGLALVGRGSVQTRSLPETLAWSGGNVAFSPFVETLGLDGSFDFDGRTLLLPDVRVTLGGNRLEGAGSVAFGARPMVQGTLAAETLNVAPLVAGVLRILGLDADESEDWSGRSLALQSFTHGDLDLRISAGSARLGPVLIEDIASSLLVREGSVEASLSRATLDGGILKGRIVLTASEPDDGQTEIRAQGGFDKLDLGALCDRLGVGTRILGQAQGQFLLDGAGASMGAVLRHLNGHAILASESGSLPGLDLAEAALRNAVPARGVGRTAFERAGVSLRFSDGLGEIVEGGLTGNMLAATLRGTVSLAERRIAAEAEIIPRVTASEARRPSATLAIAGPLNAVTVRALPRLHEPADTRGERTPSALHLPASSTPAALPATARAYAP